MASIRAKKNKQGEVISYEIRVFRGRDETGKQLKSAVMTWKVPPNLTPKQIEKELKRQEVMFEEQCKLGYSLDNRQTFAQYAEYALEQKKRVGVKHTTLTRYRDMLEKINAEIGSIRIADLRPQHLNNLYQKLPKMRENNKRAICKVDLKALHRKAELTQEELAKKAGVCVQVIVSCNRKKAIQYSKAEAIAKALDKPLDKVFHVIEDNSPLSAKTVCEYHRLISTILAQAEKEMLIQYNPASKASPPKIPKSTPNYFQPDEVRAIRDALEQVPLTRKVLVHLLLITGIRRGELAGLRWSCVDWERSKIHICHNILYRKDVGIYISTPKTNESDRLISLPQVTMELLKEYRAAWEQTREDYGTAWNYMLELPDEDTIREAENGCSARTKTVINDYLFYQEKVGRIGYPLHPDSITGWCSDFSERFNLPHINPHAFRHTMASILYFAGEDTISISARLGHTKPSTTSDLYSHIIKKADERSAENIAAAIFGEEEESRKGVG